MYRFTKYLFCMVLPALLVLPSLSHAQEGEGEAVKTEETKDVFKLKEVVVSATKTEIDPRETGASITIITKKDIEKKGKSNVVDILKEVPGLTVLQNGYFGGTASIYMRGSKSGNILVLIDGVRVNDPMGIGKHFDFAHLQTLNIERIEIIRGPQSTLYGSDATGGIINIITQKGKGDTSMEFSIEGGSYKTLKESLALSGGNDKANYSFGIARTDTEGFSKAGRAPGATNRLDKDGYESTSLTSRVGFKLPYKTWLNTGFYYSDSKADIDDGGYDDDPNYLSWMKTLSSFVELKQEILPWWSHKLSYSYSFTLRKDRDRTDTPLEPTISLYDWYDGKYQKVEWQHVIDIMKMNTITFGIDYGQEIGSSLYHYEDTSQPSPWDITHTEFDEKSARTVGFYAQNHLKLFERFYHIIGFRVDDHEEFGTHTTWQTSLSFIAPFTETRLKANYSTGFKSPSLYELYDGTNGNKDLKAEESYSYEFGLEQPLFNENVVLGATYFYNRYKNMIDWDTTYKNIGRVETKGMEALLKAKMPFNISLMASYTYTWTEDWSTDAQLIRRPEHQASANLNWELPKKMNLNLSFVYVGERDDVWYDAMWTKHEEVSEDYYKIDLFAAYWITANLQVFGRIENLTDEKYRAVAGYKSPERSYYGGIKGSI